MEDVMLEQTIRTEDIGYLRLLVDIASLELKDSKKKNKIAAAKIKN